MNSFPGVLFLLQHKHVVVEELLEFLVCEVNAKLLKPIVLRNQIGINIKENTVSYYLLLLPSFNLQLLI